MRSAELIYVVCNSEQQTSAGQEPVRLTAQEKSHESRERAQKSEAHGCQHGLTDMRGDKEDARRP